jgi:hypothetical protein
MKQLIETDLDDGVYDAIWGGYTLKLNGKDYKTQVGVKGINLPVRVEVKKGIVYFKENRII